MKRILSLALSLCMVVALAAGCSSTETPATTESSTPATSTDTSASTEQAEDLKFPERPITMIVPWSAGGAGDLVARGMSTLAEEYLGQTMTVTNREGANGDVAYTEFLTVKPDGYTLTLGVTGNFVTKQFTDELAYTFEDTTPIISLSTEPLAIIALADAEIQSVDDIVARSGDFFYGMSGVSGGTHLSVETFFKSAGITGELVPYMGGSIEIVPGLLAGDVDFAFTQPQSVRGQIESGDVKIIAFLTPERCPDYPEVPTIEELGYENVLDGSIKKWIFGPADMDPAIREYLYQGFAEMMQSPEYAEILANNASYPWNVDYDGVTEAILDMQAVVEPLVDELGWSNK